MTFWLNMVQLSKVTFLFRKTEKVTNVLISIKFPLKLKSGSVIRPFDMQGAKDTQTRWS